MRKIWTVVLAVVPPIAGFLGPAWWFRRKTRRNAAEAQPKVEAVLDEMIRIVSEWKGPLDKLVGMNESQVINDERRERDLSLHASGGLYFLDVSIRLEGKKAGWISISLSRRREGNVLRLTWPDFAEYWPPEPWLVERLQRLDDMVGNASRRRRVDSILSRFGAKDDDDDDGSRTN